MRDALRVPLLGCTFLDFVWILVALHNRPSSRGFGLMMFWLGIGIGIGFLYACHRCGRCESVVSCACQLEIGSKILDNSLKFGEKKVPVVSCACQLYNSNFRLEVRFCMTHSA